MGQFITLANFLLFAGVRTAPGLFESFGFDKSRPAFIAFVLFQYLVSPVDEVRPLAILLLLEIGVEDRMGEVRV
jgi:hypothetical protein